MHKLTGNIAGFLFLADLIAIYVSQSVRNILLGWDYLPPVSKSILTLMWAGLVLSAVILAGILVMHWCRLQGAKIYSILLYSNCVVSILILTMGAKWCIARYEGSYIINAQLAPNARFSYRPPFSPVAFSIDSQGNISIEGNTEIVTELGTFAISGGVSAFSTQPTEVQTLLLIIKHKKNGGLAETGYKIAIGQDDVFLVTRGITTTDITRNKIYIDTSGGDIERIQINGPVATS